MFLLQSTQASPIAYPAFVGEPPVQKFQVSAQNPYQMKRAKLVDALATLGTCTLVVSGIFSLLIPLINKKATTIVSGLSILKNQFPSIL